MSMSQEEIEALMSGADDIEITQEEPAQEPVIEDIDEGTSEGDDLSNDNMDEILSGIDGIVDDKEESSDSKKEADKDLGDRIDANEYPLPVKNENKVVNQLNEVADDSEEKASQIFDVLSFILDENSEIQNYNSKFEEFITEQSSLLKSLAAKFPNIDVFEQNLQKAEELLEGTAQVNEKIDAENNKVFEAMELMQFHDINRQKIERVMAVIRKLNSYLNGIFEDESDRPEVQIAKHIPGDSNDTVNSEDIESLISEFSKEG